MRVFYCNFPGRWMTGHAVVSAPNAERAKIMVVEHAKARGLTVPVDEISVTTIQRVPATIHAFDDGDY
jgi:hypothetical protein